MKGHGYRNYLLAVLIAVLAFDFIDRLALGLVLQTIKVDLRLTDTQLGFMSGIAFALFYSIMGIPIARWADRGNRVAIISITTAVWSAAVALCSASGTFIQLLLARVGVAIGEAGCVPPAHSLIADHFSRAERPRAVAIYMLGGPLSVVVGYSVAGWLNELYGWRAMFVIIGLPGLALALLVWVTLKEPRALANVATAPAPAKLADVVRALWENVTFRHLVAGFSVMLFFNYGILQWQPTFFVRSYGLKTGELGTWFAATFGIAGFVGTYVGGEWASRFAINNERLQFKWMALAVCSFGVVSSLVYLSNNPYISFGFIGVAALGGGAVNGPLMAATQTLVPGHMRATAIALVYLIGNLVGMGLGPLAAGALSDAFHGWAGEESLRYALLILCPGYFWGGWHLWRASKTVARDLEAAHLYAQGASHNDSKPSGGTDMVVVSSPIGRLE